MGIRLSLTAEEDIIGIAEQAVHLFGAVQVREDHDEMFAIFDLIAANPRMARERLELSPPIRIQPFEAHLIVYLIEANDGILMSVCATDMGPHDDSGSMIPHQPLGLHTQGLGIVWHRINFLAARHRRKPCLCH
nr:MULTISPECIES: type II toxin-antitoxin system RelE/ParE family toxin [unclassified Mesorhizobium]